DRHSAAGYVVPRIQLLQAGVDPRSDLSEQTFAGSHEAVAEMVASHRVDFGATFAHKNEKNEVMGPWSIAEGDRRSRSTPEREDRVRVLATFGKIPSDLIVARHDLDMALRVRLTRALRSMNSSDIGRRIIHELFDVDRFRLLDAEAYETLQSMARSARDQGLLA
ncbi:MAG TPA: PhnD/SsuA/transferrin family substrate-binding protein, partial [Polyangiaceae bacterium]